MDGVPRPPILAPKAQQGTQLKDLDLVKWLEAKLGTTQELWCGRVAAQLTSAEMLRELQTCFQQLETHAKLKCILGVLYLSQRQLATWRLPLVELLDIARVDADDWVELIANLLYKVPDDGVLAAPLETGDTFLRTLDDLKTIFRHVESRGQMRTTPVEAEFMSAAVINAQYGIDEKEERRHFTLKRKPKSSLLKVDVLKAAEQQAQAAREAKRTGGVISTFPIKMRSTVRQPNNTLPMRGIAGSTTKLSSGFSSEPKRQFAARPMAGAVKREGGAKMLQLDELPQSLKQRRKDEEATEKVRKQEEKEELKRKLAAEKEDRKRAAEEAKKDAEKRRLEAIEKAKEDEQAKLLEEQQQQELAELERRAVADIMEPSTSSAAHDPEGGTSTEANTSTGIPRIDIEKLKQQWTGGLSGAMSRNSKQHHHDPIANLELPSRPTLVTPQQQSQRPVIHPHQQQQQQQQHVASQMQQNHLVHQHHQQQHQQQQQQQIQRAAVIRQPVIQQQPPQQPPQQSSSQPLSVSKAVLDQAQELLAGANALDVAGQHIILQFLSGSRANPRPDLGSIITLQLSSNVELVRSVVDARVAQQKRIETYFQMDFSTGEWKRLRKEKVLGHVDLAALQQQQQQQSQAM